MANINNILVLSTNSLYNGNGRGVQPSYLCSDIILG